MFSSLCWNGLNLYISCDQILNHVYTWIFGSHTIWLKVYELWAKSWVCEKIHPQGLTVFVQLDSNLILIIKNVIRQWKLKKLLTKLYRLVQAFELAHFRLQKNKNCHEIQFSWNSVFGHMLIIFIGNKINIANIPKKHVS